MNKITLITATIASLSLATAAVAGSNSGYRYDDDRNHSYNYDYGHVTHVEPIVQQYQTSIPRQECHDEQVVYRDNSRSSATPTLIGSIIGGAIGNELGRNSDAKKGGLVIGALLGGSIGRDIGNRSSNNGGKYYRTEQVCNTYYDTAYEERITGYYVTYKYMGQTYETQTHSDPGNKIKLRIEHTPVE